MPDELAILALTAFTIAVVHTLLGPDHYLPFVVMARARGWSDARTLGVTFVCGVGHVASSVVLALVGLTLGWAATTIEGLERTRGELAGWLLIGFGVAYTAWGLRHAARNRPHQHRHVHGDGTVHTHEHTHHGEHAHLHAGSPAGAPSTTAWALFLIFVLGPCEPLIPILMVPAANASWWGLALVTAVFAVATIGTMLAATWLGCRGLATLQVGRLARYGHAMAGTALLACGLAIRFGL